MMYHVVLRGGPPLAGLDEVLRLVDEPDPAVDIAMPNVEGGVSHFRITGDYELVDGQALRVYRYVEPA
jgi:hypothetical protein